MPSPDRTFAGSIPTIYDRYLKPLLFGPYAADIAERIAALDPRTILETAAGTGLVTEVLSERLPKAQLMVTDLNEPMLALAAAKIEGPQVQFVQADAQSLPFEEGSFEAVVCQFGAMFFPDRVAAYREARRVLTPDGHFVFNVWDRIEANPATQVAADAVCGLFRSDPPRFFHRIPFGYHDAHRVKEDLAAAGFQDITWQTVRTIGRAESPMAAAIGLCQGTPLRNEIEARGDLPLATQIAADALLERFGSGPVEATMSAHVFSARA
ncbi:methyltransferase domain-containing protein [Croceibacterium sp. LX-88]|uniref:Methyltransferase domain-containing protein n=1 Tax=Croceibacterium selenioxidans TaxID=2838833 RepID=A0ABS5W0L5_9SPHN|nr:class I SAM-dependent methyltransferase [Croceibacterium selenioxidans]MBT2133313.1 methyltransferase domain-containing protein [Croceibacterium selenioxidans]